MIRVIFASILLAVTATSAAATVEAVNVWDPRSYGYFIGDTFEREVEVVTNGNTELIVASLPRPGAVTYWLDLVAVDKKERQDGARRIYNFRLKYQIFYSALSATELKVPAIGLAFRNPEAPSAPEPGDAKSDQSSKTGAVGENLASIPALTLTISPLRDIVLTDVMPDKKSEIADILKPDRLAHRLSTALDTRRLTASLVAFVLSSALLLWHYAIWPFSRRPRRPFTLAERRIRSLAASPGSEGSYRDSLLQLHRAMDETFGRRVFAADLPQFLTERQKYRALAPKLQVFFENSRRYFFSDDKRAAEAAFPIDAVQDLAAQLSREERAAA